MALARSVGIRPEHEGARPDRMLRPCYPAGKGIQNALFDLEKLRAQARDISDLPEPVLPKSQSARVRDSNYRLAEALIAEKSPDQALERDSGRSSETELRYGSYFGSLAN